MDSKRQILGEDGQLFPLTLSKDKWEYMDYLHEQGFDLYKFVLSCQTFFDKELLKKHGINLAMSWWLHWLSVGSDEGYTVSTHLRKRKNKIDKYYQ